MKLEAINSDKFLVFKANEIGNLHKVVGGYKGETQTSNQYDQIQDDGSVRYTNMLGTGRNDGFGPGN